jgi:xanthine dehydrogenase large subunit
MFSADYVQDGSGRGPKMAFDELVRKAYSARVQLWSDGFYKTPKIHYDRQTLSGRPFFYFSLGAACSEVEVDTLTGETVVHRVDILHDVGNSINPAIDIGQIEGGFIQGMGWLTTEELVWNAQGRLTTHAPSTYKIPAAGDTKITHRLVLAKTECRRNNPSLQSGRRATPDVGHQCLGSDS